VKMILLITMIRSDYLCHYLTSYCDIRLVTVLEYSIFFIFNVFQVFCMDNDLYFCSFLKYFQTCKNIIEYNDFAYIIF